MRSLRSETTRHSENNAYLTTPKFKNGRQSGLSVGV